MARTQQWAWRSSILTSPPSWQECTVRIKGLGLYRDYIMSYRSNIQTIQGLYRGYIGILHWLSIDPRILEL